ncbi:hypothetical protein CAPTEDRAFT_187446 [Capitella teleta]|uniref:VWFD domain-containing protein n=1 Tax=Capitella teleta TaxID=283909 RepID=R7VKE6_CAPTE|nr:hypothetical protein CAPTEDRAFT_187446 [Capitella teleta]|eukprot:ELU17306.1 hypothetical protein CAPTEDRAFT_187446 [Capitella teleta]
MAGWNCFIRLFVTCVLVKSSNGEETTCDLSGFSSSLSILEPTFSVFISPIIEAVKEYSVGNEDHGSGSGSGTSGGVGLPIGGFPGFGLPNNGGNLPGSRSGKFPLMPKIRKKRDTDDLIEKVQSADIPSLSKVMRLAHDEVNWNRWRDSCRKLNEIADEDYIHFKIGLIQCEADIKETLEKKLSELQRVIEPICEKDCESISRFWSPLLQCHEQLTTLDTDSPSAKVCLKMQDKMNCMMSLVTGCKTAENALSDLLVEHPVLRSLEDACSTAVTGEDYTGHSDQEEPVTAQQQEDNSCQFDTLVDCFDDVIASFMPVLQPLVDYIGGYGRLSGRESQNGPKLLEYLRGLKEVELVNFLNLQEHDLDEMDSAAGCQAIANLEKMESCTAAKIQSCGDDVVNRMNAKFEDVYKHLHAACQEGCGHLNEQLLQHNMCSDKLIVDPSDRFPSSEICIQKIASAKECFYQSSVDIECPFIVASFERLLSELTADCEEDVAWELDSTIQSVELDELQCGNVALISCFSKFDQYFGPFIEPLMNFLKQSPASISSGSESRNPSLGRGLPGFPPPGSSNPRFKAHKQRGVATLEDSEKRSITLRSIEDISASQFMTIDFDQGCRPFVETVTCAIKGISPCQNDAVRTSVHSIISMVFNSISPYCTEGCSEISTDFEYLSKCAESFESAKELGNEETCKEYDITKTCFDNYTVQGKCSALEAYTEAMYQKWQSGLACNGPSEIKSSPSPMTTALSDILDEKQPKTEVKTVIPDCSLDPIIACLGLLTKSFAVVMNPVVEKFRELSREANKGGEGPEINFREKKEPDESEKSGGESGRGRGRSQREVRRKRQLNFPEGFEMPSGITLPSNGPPPNNNFIPGLGLPQGRPGSECRESRCPKDVITLTGFEDLSPMKMVALKFDRGCGLLENMENTNNCVNRTTQECDDATTTMVKDTVVMIKSFLLPLCGSDCRKFGNRLLRLKRCKEKMEKSMQGITKENLLRTNKFDEMCREYRETMSCYTQYETEPGWCSYLSNYNNKTRPKLQETFEEACPEPTTTSTTVKPTTTNTATTPTSSSVSPSTTPKRTTLEKKTPTTTTTTPPGRDKQVTSTLPKTDSESQKPRPISVEDRLTELLNKSSKNTNSPDKGLEINAGKGVFVVQCNLLVLFSCYNDMSQHFEPFVQPVFQGLSSIGRRGAGGGRSMSSGSGSGRGTVGQKSGRGFYNGRSKRYASESKVRHRRESPERKFPILPGFGSGQKNSLEGVSVFVPSIRDLSAGKLRKVNFELGCGSLGMDRNDCLLERGQLCGKAVISTVNETMVLVEEYLEQFCEEGCETMASVLANLKACTELISRTTRSMRPPDWRREKKVWAVCVQYHYMMECSLAVLDNIICPAVFNVAYNIIQPISNQIKDLCEVVLTTTTTTMSTTTTPLPHSECFVSSEQDIRACFSEVKSQLKTMSVSDWRNSKKVAQFCSLHRHMEECLDRSEYSSCSELSTVIDGEVAGISSAIGDVCVMIETTSPSLVGTSSLACETLDEQKTALDKCSIEVRETLKSVIEEDWGNPVMKSLLCAQYKTMLTCQYKIILSDVCAELKVYANESLYTAYFKLTEACDVQLPNEALNEASTEVMIPQPDYCMEYYEKNYLCSQDMDAKLDSYTINDWRQDDKVKAILVATPHVECDNNSKEKLEKCHKEIDDKLGKNQPIEQASKVHVDQICKAYKRLLQCQYGILLTGLCHELRREANSTLSRINVALEGTCDHVLAKLSTQTIVTTELPDVSTISITTEDPCSDIETRLMPLKNCTQNLWNTIDSYSVADWRDDRKVIDICKQWNEVPSCVASLNLVDPCIDLVLAANETLFHLEVSFSGICSEVILPEMTTPDTILETTTYPVCQNERADFSACVDTFLDLINNLTAAHWMNDTIIEVICREHSAALICHDFLTITCDDVQSLANQTLAEGESLLGGICSETKIEKTSRPIQTTALPFNCLDEGLISDINSCSDEVTDAVLTYQESTETICRKFDEFIFCQYKVLMGSECASLHDYSQEAFDNITRLLGGICEGLPQMTTSAVAVDSTIGTTQSDCPDIEKEVEDCWVNTTEYYKTLTALDFRNEMKVDNLCQFYVASMECNASLTSQNDCPVIITAFTELQNIVSKFAESCASIGVHDGITTQFPDFTSSESFTDGSCKFIKEEERQLTECSTKFTEFIQNATDVDTLDANEMKLLCGFYDDTILCQYIILVSTECASLDEIAARQNEDFKEVIQDRCSVEHVGASDSPETSTIHSEHSTESTLNDQETSIKNLELYEETTLPTLTTSEDRAMSTGHLDKDNTDQCPAQCYCSLGCPNEESVGDCHEIDACTPDCECLLGSDERVNGRCGSYLPVYSCETSVGPLTTRDPSWCPDECYCALGCEDESDSIGECSPLSSTCPYSCVCHKGADERIHGRCGRFKAKDLC